jgi:glycosyltransferase involved in cell wall biosynthesis
VSAPLRVLHVLDSFTSGGAQAVAVQLGGWLAEHGVEVHVTGTDGPLAAEARRADRPGVQLHVSPPRGPLGRLLALDRLCRRVRPDVLHAHQRREALECLVVGALRGVPVVEHAHTWLPRTGVRALSFRSRRVFAVSGHVARMVAERYGRGDRVVVVGNAPARVSDRPVVPPRRRTPDQPLRLLALGRLAEQKDPLRFVRVVAAVARRAPVQAVWHGEGPLLDEARALAERLGAPVVFAGLATDVTARLDEADALVLTSGWEGLPLVVLEAFARHRPVVATAACGSPGALDDGRAVVVPDDASDEAFAEAVLRGLADPATTEARVAVAARWLTRHATPDAVGAPVLSAYHGLRATPRRTGARR